MPLLRMSPYGWKLGRRRDRMIKTIAPESVPPSSPLLSSYPLVAENAFSLSHFLSLLLVVLFFGGDNERLGLSIQLLLLLIYLVPYKWLYYGSQSSSPSSLSPQLTFHLMMVDGWMLLLLLLCHLLSVFTVAQFHSVPFGVVTWKGEIGVE